MIRREQQRFSLRKYKVGVASVFLGTTLSFLMANGGAVKASEIIAQSNSGENTELVDKDQSKDPVANVEDTVVTETSEVKSETSRPEVKSEEVKSEEAKAEKIEKKTSVSPEAKPESSKPAASSKAEEVVVAKPKAEEKTESKSEEKSEPKAELSAVAEATSLDTNASAANVEAKPQADTETLALAAENTVNAGALATNGGRRRNRRAATEEVVSGDHNSKPIAVTTYLKDGEVATPNMTNSNGASVRSQTVPAGYSAKEGDWYTYAIWDLTRFNERYGTKYYARAYKRFDESTDTNVDLIDKTTGAVVETRTITASSGVQKFTTTTAASNSQLTFQVDYKAGTAEKGKTTQPFIQNGYEVGKSITDLVAPGHQLTPAEQKLYSDVYNARTTTDVLNVVEPAYNGRTITDSNAKIPETINKTTYYKVVDKNNPTFNANKTDKTVQDYKENGNEVDLARYTLKAEEGQRFTASGERQFDGYKLYQRADANDQSGFVNRPYTIGSKFMDADRYGIKRIKEVVGEDGSVVIRVYLLDPRQQSKRSDGSLSTDGYMLLAETKPIKPGENNTQELVVKKTPLNTIAHTVTDPKTGAKTNYPNGKEVTFDFQKAAGYTPYKSVFVPFLGDGIGHGSANAQLERGVGGIGTNVDLLNTLTPYKQPIYYYVKQDPVQVTPEVEKQLEGRSLKDGEFTFKLTEDKSSPDRYEETVTNKSGKATFSKLTFNKAGTYKYKITETKGSDTNVDYDAMTVTMTVTVTENSKGDLQATTTYSAEGGFKSSENDKIFNNYVVAPVKTKFDFSKALAGRELKAGEFTFQLKDSKGTVLQTKTNTKAGLVAFDDLTFDNTQVGTHKYTVEEVQGSEAGMTYDPMKAEVTITVTKEGHVLKATNTLPADREFNNTFTPAPVKVNLEFDKSLSNGTLNAGDFSFTLTGDNNVSETVTNKANGKINFSELSFDKVGVYNYTVKEVKGNKADVDYDAMTIAVKVTVTKDATTGLLSAKTEMTSTGGEATGADDKVFNNHVVAPVTAQFDFSKALAGRKLKAGEFSFVLKNSEGTVLQTKQNDADGKVKFDALTFTNTQVGNHKYTVEEVIPETKEAGMTYDTMKANVTVSVTKSGHALTAVATLPQDKEFNNTFTPTATQVQFKFTKRLEGKELTKDAFTFELLENGNVIQTKKNAADGTIQFDAIAYDQEGRHTYTVREVAGADTNIDYDSMNAVVTVNVTKDAATGVLTANVTMPSDTEFNNFAVAPVKTKFDFSKALAGRELKAGEFTFQLKDSKGTVLQTKTNTKAGLVAFDDLTFDNTQVGTHKYTVEEVQGSEAGMQYDTMKAEVTITVTKEGHVLKATNTLPADTEFNNTFTPAATQAQFKFTKRLEGKTLEADAFTFELLENGNVIQTKKNAADGTIQFDAIAYAQEGTHTYTVREVAGADTNIDYDSMNAVVTVNVTKDAASGILTANVTMPADTEFNNFAVAPVKTKFDFSKALAGRELKAGEFTFQLKDSKGTVLQTKTNTKAGLVAFDDLTFDNTQVGTHKYTVEEVQGSEAGMQYDTMKAEVTITVTKEGHVLKATNTLPADTEFNNTFTPAATQAQFKFTKKLEGKELTKDAFTFELLENGNVIQTKKNAADGSITFDAIEYNAVGEHTYTVREVAGADTNIDYDSMNAVVTVNVTKDAASGILTANVTMPSDTEFNNYHVAPVVARFDFTKKLAGRELKEGEFSFVLKDSTGQTLETVTNKADGTVTFSELSFDNTKVGTHTYTVEEVIPSTKELGMTYDTMKATVTVEVAKNGHTLTTVTNVTSTGGVNADGTSTEGTDDKEFNNKITPPETPEFQPEKFVLNKEKFDITGTKLVDDDDELTDEYTATNANPYADGTSNNEAENINTKTVERGDKLVYQVWLDTKNFTDKNNIQSVGISDTYDAEKLTVNAADIKAYDSESGDDVTDKFDIKVENGVITATSKTSVNKSLGDADNTQVIDTTKFAFGRYYKFDIPATVKADVAGGVDIENKANQIVHVYNPVNKSVEKPEKPTQKRVNSVPISVEFNFTKKLEGRELKANEFSFVLKDSTGKVVETVSNDAAGNVKFSALTFKKGQEGVHNYTVEEVKGSDATVTYDTMKANVTVTVKHDGTAKVLVATVGNIADKEFNNTVRPPEEPKFQPEKYVVSEEKFDITGDKLVDDDKELADKYGDTNKDPYADKTDNNEAQNLNTKTVKRGDKLVYQVWLDTTKFDAANKDNIQSVGISDDYDETKLDLDATKIKAYDSVTGDDVTAKFDITVNNGVITATLKDGFTKSLGDAENTQVIDTTKFAFGRYYKFDIPTKVKADVPGGVDIENTAAQVVNYYNPVSKTVEKPNKPTEKRVNSVPVEVEFNFTKRLEGRELKANEFSFVLKDSEGKTLETVSNDASGNVKFSKLEFKKGQEGVHNYTVEEVKGSDATVTYDTMKANVTVTVKHDGTA
ncbi:Spy0128 family protein, partial [Streptococcus infantis]|uniref:Spy0128 family protein n=1 Tax=Streptococcus infantis TaxID=68892 RepID=UPI0039C26613